MAKSKVQFTVLKYNQICMSWCGIYSDHLKEPSNEFFKSFATYWTLVSMVLAIVSSAWYIVENRTIHVKESLGAFKIAFAAFQSTGMFLSIGMKMIDIKALHLELQKIVDKEYENDEVYNIYWINEQKCRKYIKVIGSYVILPASGFIIVFMHAVGCIAFGIYDTSLWHLIMFTTQPFSSTHVYGWFATWLLQLSMTLAYGACMISITSYFMSCCFYIDAMCKHFQLLLNAVKQSVETKVSQNIGMSNTKCWDNTKLLCKAIECHIKILDVFYKVANIHQGGIFFLLPFNVILMGVSMYDLEESVSHFETWGLIWDLSCFVCGLLWPAIICYFATFATGQIASLGHIAFESNWYEYPVELQKYIILIIMRSNESVYFTGFGLVHCTLEVLKELFNKSCTYYMIFRKIAKR